MRQAQAAIPNGLQEARDGFAAGLIGVGVFEQHQVDVGMGEEFAPAIAAHGKRGKAVGKDRS